MRAQNVLRLALLSLLTAPAFAQNARDAEQLDVNNGGRSFAPSVATDGELTAIAYPDDVNSHVYVHTSDGCALDWSSEVIADVAPAGAGLAKFTIRTTCGVSAATNSVYVNWDDVRNDDPFTTAVEIDVFLNVSTNGGASFPNNEVRVPNGYAPGVASVRDWHMVVTNNGATDLVYFALSVDPDPDGMPNGLEEIWLSVLDVNAASWTTSFVPSGYAPQGADADFMTLAADGDTAVIFWNDSRDDPDPITSEENNCFFRYTTDAGASFAIADTQVDSSAGETGDANFGQGVDVDLDLANDLIAFAWAEERSDLGGNEEAYCRTYDLGTDTFNSASDILVTPAATANPGGQDTDGCEVAIIDGNVCVLNRDNRNDPVADDNQIFVLTSTDGGATFPNILTAPQISPNAVGGSFAEFPNEIPDSDVFVAYWTGGSFPNESYASFTRDGGVTWSLGANVSNFPAGPPDIDVDFHRGGFNNLYKNFVSTFLADDPLAMNHVYYGGYRPQTVIPMGTYQFGNNVSFGIENFPESEEGASFQVRVAKNLGTTGVLADGRMTHLRDDVFFRKTGNLSQLRGTILVGGVGQTGSFPFPNTNKVPVGTTLYHVAYAFQGAFFGALTDIVIRVSS